MGHLSLSSAELAVNYSCRQNKDMAWVGPRLAFGNRLRLDTPCEPEVRKPNEIGQFLD